MSHVPFIPGDYPISGKPSQAPKLPRTCCECGETPVLVFLGRNGYCLTHMALAFRNVPRDEPAPATNDR